MHKITPGFPGNFRNFPENSVIITLSKYHRANYRHRRRHRHLRGYQTLVSLSTTNFVNVAIIVVWWSGSTAYLTVCNKFNQSSNLTSNSLKSADQALTRSRCVRTKPKICENSRTFHISHPLIECLKGCGVVRRKEADTVRNLSAPRWARPDRCNSIPWLSRSGWSKQRDWFRCYIIIIVCRRGSGLKHSCSRPGIEFDRGMISTDTHRVPPVRDWSNREITQVRSRYRNRVPAS